MTVKNIEDDPEMQRWARMIKMLSATLDEPEIPRGEQGWSEAIKWALFLARSGEFARMVELSKAAAPPTLRVINGRGSRC